CRYQQYRLFPFSLSNISIRFLSTVLAYAFHRVRKTLRFVQTAMEMRAASRICLPVIPSLPSHSQDRNENIPYTKSSPLGSQEGGNSLARALGGGPVCRGLQFLGICRRRALQIILRLVSRSCLFASECRRESNYVAACAAGN